MSKREELIRALAHPAVQTRPFEAIALVDAFAHELAEQIRAERDAANIPGSPASPDIIRGMGDAADLIDPEASKGWDEKTTNAVLRQEPEAS